MSIEEIAVLGGGNGALTMAGDLCGVETPIADSLLHLIGVITGEDYRQTGRTLENLGLSGKGADDIARLLQQGFPERGKARQSRNCAHPPKGGGG